MRWIQHTTLSIVALCALSAELRADDAKTATKQPNVIILFIDDLGMGDVGFLGNQNIPTPHIDALAAQGVELKMSYVTNPPCSPSRSCLVTGMFAQKFGKFGMARGLPISEDHPTIAEFMRDAGYVTGQIGKWDLGSLDQGPHQRGFMEVAKWAPGKAHDIKTKNGKKAYRTELDGDYMVEFIERNKDKPFFLYFSPFAIHGPLDNTPKIYTSRIKKGDKAYGGAVAAVDDQVGKLLAVLKKHQLEQNTLILFTGDNGAHQRGSSAPYRGGKGKGTQQEGWVHTPGIAWWPGTIPAGQSFTGITCTLDYYATAAALAGKQAPQQCDGKNLLPYLTGKKQGDVHEHLCWYNADPKDAARRHLSAVRWQNWRLVLDQDTKQWHLYDLIKDPREENDLIAQHPQVAARMKQMHADFVAGLPSLDSIPPYDNHWAKPPEGWGWIIGDGKK